MWLHLNTPNLYTVSIPTALKTNITKKKKTENENLEVFDASMFQNRRILVFWFMCLKGYLH